MQESHLRSVLKGISWRIFATSLTAVITLLVTHQIALAFYIGFFEFFSKILFFYFHERIWGMILFGRSKTLAEKDINEATSAYSNSSPTL